VVGAALGGWAMTQSGAAANPGSRLVPVARTNLQQTITSTGTIASKATATESFSASGQVTAVDVTVGQHVRAGQKLAVMDSASLRAQVAQAEASLAGAQARLSQDQASGAGGTQLTADQASVDSAQSQLNSANSALDGATLTSPITGIVTAVGLTVGEQVSGGGGGGGASGGGGGGGASGGSGSSTPSINVASLNDVINANVSPSVVSQIKTGDQVMISAAGTATPVPGTVASIGLIATVSSGVATFPVVVDVTGTPSGLYVGASATISITYNQVSNALVVPAGALFPQPGGGMAVTVMVNGRRVRRPVTTGITSGGLTQITSGLTAGEQVVLTQLALPAGGPGPGFRPGPGKVFVGPGGQIVHINRGPGPVGVPPGG
jgi:multidrug efflux pump subunit AcrA (membrane-fusion protein)